MPEIEEEKRLEEKKENSAEPNQDYGEENEAKKKRTADRQITKDDGEDDDEDGAAKLNQPFQKASDEVLSKRKILKVKRPANGGSKPASSNPFAATTLTASTTNASDSGAKVFGGGSAFSGFGGFGSSKSSTSGGFGSSSGSGFGNAFGGGSSGFGSASSSSGGFGAKASSSKDDDTAKASTSLFGKPTGSTGFSFGFAKPSSAKDSESSAASAAVTLPENVKLTTGEEDEVKMHEVRCKSFKMVAQVEAEAADERKESANPSVKPSSNFANKNQESSKSSDEKESDEEDRPQHRWQEVGTGPLKILRSTDHGDRFRMVQRQESSKNGPAHKVILNVPLWKEATCAELSEKQLRLTTPGSGESSTFTLKFKEAGEALVFSECIKDVCAEAKSCFASSD